jgi:hypothetical protein
MQKHVSGHCQDLTGVPGSSFLPDHLLHVSNLNDFCWRVVQRSLLLIRLLRIRYEITNLFIPSMSAEQECGSAEYELYYYTTTEYIQ